MELELNLLLLMRLTIAYKATILSRNTRRIRFLWKALFLRLTRWNILINRFEPARFMAVASVNGDDAPFMDSLSKSLSRFSVFIPKLFLRRPLIETSFCWSDSFQVTIISSMARRFS